ncbi:MerR family transcriptional regulator [Phaeobacter gallaeciensis]|uniref:MerR family transcriptional regulator n=1 Tax=Phaeobacter gallaeciensis TaxID=60890 RepID=UPI00237FA74D|nr:helix-turn-helix domain-containing protein [Phaeobacter gallaeciensis]MDE4099708.1 helix-turn-helix domain-containing protein [Phaeobacter gallaeciensis]MDE4108557.1 helix-turn-helix domain-containing protein [Phaeobacter gallaeciensis]MDE4110427.1 helix-turn-helix domain-containing protein [Phaeobacter gallaeciensis]MDE4117349.1 helix-turn-helix domain-containing protein [Phaeobacter gallaeciensis]MDE4121822.1 helix-turn-helix domain-containing protein [Phaeobacter gallaeciensis]
MPDHKIAITLTRGELARATGCNLETIRYYEKIGIIPNPPRTAAGHRIYGQTYVQRLHFILRARELGFAIDEIKGLLSLVDGGTQTCGEVKAVTELHLVDVRKKIADLRRIEQVLDTTAAQCSGEDIPDCPVLDALFEEPVTTN